MSITDDRRRIGMVLRQLDNIGSEVLRDQDSAESAMRASTEGLAAPQLIGEIGEQRTRLALASFSRQQRKLEFADVMQGMTGTWIEGFIVGAMFMRQKLEG